MGDKLVIGPVDRGLRTDRTAFNIDNDSFPTLINAFQWRGRVKRKRGTSALGRLNRAITGIPLIGSTDGSGNFSINLYTALGITGDPTIVAGTIQIGVNSGGTYVEPTIPNGTLSNGSGGTGTINYATGALTLTNTGQNNSNVHVIAMSYYPDLPVMGEEDLVLTTLENPGTLAFDTTYSYNINTSSPYNIYDVSFYKNPLVDGTNLPGYVRKTTQTPLIWNGQNYQQFWSTNYQGAFWTTNGITVPFDPTNIGMQFKTISPGSITGYTAGPPATVTFNINGHGLVVGDFIYVNEVQGIIGLNWQSGYVTTRVDVNNFTATFPFATLSGAYTQGGIVQYLTNNADSTKDCIRWYDGDPTTSLSPLGWVNFMPPLSQGTYSINDLPPAIYYLAGARMIVPFKDRLVFFGPVVQSSTGTPIYLQDTVVYSQNGTPYYTSSYTNTPLANADTPTSVTNVFHPILVPANQTATAPAYFEDQTGFGGFLSAGVQQAITTVNINEDALIVGFYNNLQTRFIYSGNDIQPFNFFIVNSELGSSSTFSAVTMDQGVITRGVRGFIMTSQTTCNRIDLDILDQAFEISNLEHGSERFCAQRDFINEWIYFTYSGNQSPASYVFPDQTLQFNYRDNSWAIVNECYTTYGTFRRQTGETWATIGNTYATWSAWNEPWAAGESTLLQPQVIGGNQQGFIVFKGIETGEAPSLYIGNISFSSSITGATIGAGPTFYPTLTSTGNYAPGQLITISGVVGMTQLNGNTYSVISSTTTTVTINVNGSAFSAYISGGTIVVTESIYSPNHTLTNGDYIIINGCLGTISSQVNGRIFQVQNPTVNGFTLSPSITSGTYLGLGTITRIYKPQIQTKQFPTAWGIGRKTRIGPQMYLFTTTANSQITLQIYLSQNAESPYNSPPDKIYPDPSSPNNSLIYSNILYTCPESTNLGLTPANINLQMVTATQQEQTWHRMNTSLIGDTVQIGFTLSPLQLSAQTPITSSNSITGATNANPCVLTCNGNYSAGTMILIMGVGGMIQLNSNIYQVLTSNSTTVTIDVNSTGFGTYTSGGTATPVAPVYQFAEIEFHGAVIDTSPSMLLV